jgi:hypothetical protein
MAEIDWNNVGDLEPGGGASGTVVIPPSSNETSIVKPSDIILRVNDLRVYTDVPAYVDINDRTIVPIRFISEALGAKVVWDAKSQKVTITRRSTIIQMTVGSRTFHVNGTTKNMDTVPVIKNSRSMVPVRFVAEAFGAQVNYGPYGVAHEVAISLY